MKKICLLVARLFFAFNVASQCPTITVPSTLTLTNCQTGNTIAAISNYSANITSRWIGPGGIPMTSSGTSTSVIDINYTGTYTVEFTDQSSNCTTIDSVQVSSSIVKPSFGLQISSYTMLCTSSLIQVSIINPQGGGGGVVNYTLLPPGFNTLPATTFSASTSYTVNSCGSYVAVVQDGTGMCVSSFAFEITCSTITPIPINVIGSGTVCGGSSITFTAINGSNLSWPNGTINVIPGANTIYTVTGTDLNNCPTTGTALAVVNNTCSDVWPGDANSDGIVDNTDIFELGLASGATGPLRPSASIVFTSQQTSSWNGIVSTGKNLCHADCNGDGIINTSDQTAISANYSLAHIFKPSEENSNNPNIYLVASQIMATGGLWNKADIFLGDVQSPITSVYGVAFDLDFDHSYIEADSVKIVYTPSFLNSSSQNIEFKKNSYVNDKAFAANVRSDGSNVNGQGKIGEFHYKMKTNIAEGTFLNLGISNAKMVDSNGSRTMLAGNNFQLLIDPNPEGISKNENSNKIFSVYPNPAKNFLNIVGVSEGTSYEVIGILGSKITEGALIDSGLDVSNLENGTYFLKIKNKNQKTSIKRFVISR